MPFFNPASTPSPTIAHVIFTDSKEQWGNVIICFNMEYDTANTWIVAPLTPRIETTYNPLFDALVAEDEDDEWDETFLSSQDMLIAMANEALADYKAGRTKPIRLRAA